MGRAAASEATNATSTGQGRGQRRPARRPVTPAAVTALLVLGSLAIVLAFDAVDFVVFNPGAKTGFEMFLALGQIFGALVILLATPADDAGRRPWVAVSMFALGFGALTFGYFAPTVLGAPGINDSVGHGLFVRTIGMLLIVIGFVPRHPLPLGIPRLVAILAATGGVSMLMLALERHLPPLVAGANGVPAEGAGWAFPGLTAWYAALNLIPVIAGVAASWRAAQCYEREALEGWIVVAVVLLAGVHIHAIFWPPVYSSVLTTTSVLRLALAVTVVVGGVVSLRNLANERASLLALEQQRVRQLEDLARLRRDFSAMVAHELATPVATVGNLARIIGSGTAPPDLAADAARQIGRQAHAMGVLVRDIQESADVERVDFSVTPRPVPVATLLDVARDHARSLAATHPVTVNATAGGMVRADPDRIGQVLRNLVTNAARHTPPGTPVTIEAAGVGERVRITVQDAGPGIDPADRAIIMEKFGRGRDAAVAGHGLGLYLSQRILEAHGTALALESSPGLGARFSFDLERLA